MLINLYLVYGFKRCYLQQSKRKQLSRSCFLYFSNNNSGIINLYFVFVMKKLILLLLFISLFSCDEKDNDLIGDCVVSPNPEIICTKDYKPVCACNNLVYSNSCEAEKAGNIKWKSTNKVSGEECSY